MKDFFVQACLGGGAACLFYLFGGLDMPMQTIIFFLVIDFILGTVYAIKTHTVESRKAWDGLVKKFVTLSVIVVAHQIDKLMGTDGVFRLVAIYGFIGSELYSIIENVGLLGVKIPEKLSKYFKQFTEGLEEEKKDG